MEGIIQEYSDLTGLSLEEVQVFMDIGVEKHFKAKDVLLPFQSTERKIFLVLKGILRSYIQEEEDQINKVFYFKGELASVLHVNLLQAPSNEAIACLTDAHVLEIDYQKLLDLSEENTKITLLKNKLMEKKFFELELRVVDLISKNASQRYEELIEKHKNIDYLVSQYHIASYLGVSPIQLSRIRKKLFRTI